LNGEANTQIALQHDLDCHPGSRKEVKKKKKFLFSEAELLLSLDQTEQI